MTFTPRTEKTTIHPAKFDYPTNEFLNMMLMWASAQICLFMIVMLISVLMKVVW